MDENVMKSIANISWKKCNLFYAFNNSFALAASTGQIDDILGFCSDWPYECAYKIWSP